MDWCGNISELLKCETMGKESDNEIGVSLQSDDVAWYDDLAKLVWDLEYTDPTMLYFSSPVT